MATKLDRIGEKRLNNFGSKMVIVGYRMNRDIDVYFPEYNWTARNVAYNNFKKGNIKCPYERRVYGVGYIGEGKYKSKENGKNTRVYDTWRDMLRRCYDEKLHKSCDRTCMICKYDGWGANCMLLWILDNYEIIRK